MISEIALVGHPSALGGADTEAYHQVLCWLQMGLKVHICHTGDYDMNLLKWKAKCKELGCVYHKSRDWPSLVGLHVVSFCNGEYLEALPKIAKYAQSTSFINCMTWNHKNEIEMQDRGLIDFHLYQTDHAMKKVRQGLDDSESTYRPLRFDPYFDVSLFPFIKDRLQNKFRFGRISRGDADKYGGRQLWIYEMMTAPVLKEGIILGWDDRARKKFDREPPSYVQALPEGGITQQEFYTFCDAVIMTTETFENLPRVGFEAMASGSILVVDNRGGWQTLVKDGVTGWLCNDDREFVYKASRVAFERKERAEMAVRARESMDSRWGMDAASASWKKVFEAWESV